MEASERKKLMPTITHYLSDDDNVDLDDCDSIGDNNQTTSNYAEWKKMKTTDSTKRKKGAKLKNGVRKPRIRSDGTLQPLGDISSSDNECNVDDEQTIGSIFQGLVEKTIQRKSLTKGRRKKKKPSKYLIFCRHKHAAYLSGSNRDWSFSELCRICQSLWDNMRDSDNEDLEENLEQRRQQYTDLLSDFKDVLLSDYKQSSVVPVPAPTPSVAAAPVPTRQKRIHRRLRRDSSNSISSSSSSNGVVDNTTVGSAVTEEVIPERLASLAGSASVYHTNRNTTSGSGSTVTAPGTSNGRHSVFSYRGANSNSTGTELHYVASNSSAGGLCRRASCSEAAVEDPRWNRDYCSTDCLMAHCAIVFRAWLEDRSLSRMQKDATANMELMSSSSDDADKSVVKQEPAAVAQESPQDKKRDTQMHKKSPVQKNESCVYGDSVSVIKKEESQLSTKESHTSVEKKISPIGKNHIKSPLKEENLFASLQNHFSGINQTDNKKHRMETGRKRLQQLGPKGDQHQELHIRTESKVVDVDLTTSSPVRP